MYGQRPIATPFGERLRQLANECVGGDNRGAEVIFFLFFFFFFFYRPVSYDDILINFPL